MTHIEGSEFQRPSASPAVGLLLAFFGLVGVFSPWGPYAVGYGESGNGWESYEALYANDKFSNGPFFTLALSSCVIALGGYIARNQRQGKPSNGKTIGVLAMIIGFVLLATGYFTNRALGDLLSEIGVGFSQGFGLLLSHLVSIAVILSGLLLFKIPDLTDGIQRS